MNKIESLPALRFCRMNLNRQFIQAGINGIRKVIGASVSNVVAMLSKDFLMLVLIALCIAIPVSWWAANEWLQSFAYRINISPLIFVITAVVVALITIITISFQSIKAAIANPVKSLRTE